MEYNIQKSDYGVYFISDMHIAHKNIMKHQPSRVKYAEEYGKENGIEDINEAHDKWLIDLWLRTTKRNDIVYVLGDFIMSNQETALKLLHKLKSHGCKIHLIVGNHDKSIHHMYNMFESIELIKVVNFHKTAFPFIEEENFQCVLCHFPMKSWFNKCRGAAMIYGHVHDNSPWMDKSLDLSFNVGFDTPLANMGLIPLEKLYQVYKEKLNGKTPREYINWATETDSEFIR